jgi:hypothetical protein
VQVSELALAGLLRPQARARQRGLRIV